MTTARERVDRQLSWMVAPGRPSAQKADEEDGASAEFLVNEMLVVVFAAHDGPTELYALQPRGQVLWEFTIADGEELPAVDRDLVTDLLDEMGKQVLFPAPVSRTMWRDDKFGGEVG